MTFEKIKSKSDEMLRLGKRELEEITNGRKGKRQEAAAWELWRRAENKKRRRAAQKEEGR